MKRLIMDLDDTLTKSYDGSYMDVLPNKLVIEKLREYKEKGFEIVINTSRNMRTYSGNVGLINANTLPIILKWLEKHDVPFDEIYTGKPWCGNEGFYVDDKSIRPSEFAKLNYEEIVNLLSLEKSK
ncbi:capsular biosynthesis protein [Bermanella sp. WJH001]|uniref:capsular biosynthesis protein n=1 Tax=Bermanella sp. WJH001 TaxID=3048005 RepID=UPI0024BD8300|nr:capsular biosynthesis protein [Bermanella sp. WJH001]MDJ1536771.1 capsular biosynthesis protein [Bermanella sp. WJH001]